MTRLDRESPLFSLVVKGSPLMYLMQIYDYKTGVCPTTIQQIQVECGLTRQQVRTALKNLEKDNILTVSTYAGAIKGERGFRKVSTITFNLEHELFKKPKGYLGTSVEIPTVEVEEGYPKEFDEDWKVYCGKSRDKVGQKKPAYKSWVKAVSKHGRDRVMQGTIAYVAMCESKNPPQWKKNGATWWNAKEARYLDTEFQQKDHPSIAFWKLMNSPMLGNILNGDSKIVIQGDQYMAEALVRLKGSDPYLGTTLDRLRDKKFEEAFKKSYELAKRSPSPRTEIYTTHDQTIIWNIGPDIDTGSEPKIGESTSRIINS